ncbi:unnamed protein product [Oikopleura dioica]|uniref:Uncharacterized protein n=2 Tax=Oikopleura dioica TaxID=34765 RepID=E4XF85_OIKDI|nr:unnamed protein product [Oikopleura dioica]
MLRTNLFRRQLSLSAQSLVPGRVPFWRKGTKGEPEPKTTVKRPEYDGYIDLSMPHNRQIKDGKLIVKRKGDDWNDYTFGAENAQNTDPLFLSKTVMVDNPEDPASVAMALQKFEQFQTREGINRYYGYGYRFKEANTQKRRRLAYNEVKKTARDELKRKIAFTMLMRQRSQSD